MKTLTITVFALALTFTGAAFGQEDYQNAGATESQVNGNAAKYAPTLGNAAFGTSALEVRAKVDREYCATGGVQCAGLTPGVPAQKTNRNPIRIGLEVLDSGAPVTTVATADVTVNNPFVPAGGTAVNRFSCATCFQNGGNGLYTIFLNPFGAANWKAGTYFVQVVVTSGSSTARRLIQVDIPF